MRIIHEIDENVQTWQTRINETQAVFCVRNLYQCNSFLITPNDAPSPMVRGIQTPNANSLNSRLLDPFPPPVQFLMLLEEDHGAYGLRT